jgi:signal transduction histidine kinase
MRIATRITLTVSLVVLGALGAFGLVRARTIHGEVDAQLAREAVQLAAALRSTLESGMAGPLAITPELQDALARASTTWHIRVIDAEHPPTDDPAIAERLHRLLAVRAPIVDERAGDGFVYLEPLHRPAPTADGFAIVGALQLSHQRSDGDGTLGVWVPLAVIALVLVLAVYVSVQRSLGRPAAKLIAGIDGVARGDLSHVVLSEREDELGALASRFNDMTGSLREAQDETHRAADARAQIERHLRASERLATVGSIAAEIAHEVGTPLNVVTGRARAMARKADDPDAVQKNANIIAEQATRITRIIQRLLDFARRRVGDADVAQAIDLAGLAGGVLEFLEHQASAARVTTSLRSDQGLSAIIGKRDALEQVVLNLCVNAIQAMPQGGDLKLRLSSVVRRRPGLELAPEQRYAVLEIADTGVGVAAEDRDKVFEPFYTSRAEGGGSGLGLTVSNGIVKEHDGWLELDDNRVAGRGTIFRVVLPMSYAEPS